MRIGVLTSGGDCPGLNAAIRAVTRRLISEYDADVLGIRNGLGGLVAGEIEPLSLYSVSGILPKGGTILGTSRTNPFVKNEDPQKILDNLLKYEIDALIIIGDGDAISSTHKLAGLGVKAVCIPTTIDNDIYGTDMTFGFDTAVNIATEAIDRLHSTADSHHRIMVVEVMGRKTGWIATMSGLAGGADCVLIPEIRFSLDEVAALLTKRHKRRKFSIVVVAEGVHPEGYSEPRGRERAPDQFGYRSAYGVGEYIGAELEKRTGMETRFTVLGHIQRGGTPTPYDRILATRFGVKAADMITARRFSYMTALRGTEIAEIPLAEVAGKTKQVDPNLFEIASVFFG